jgi:hypothetical protein
MGCIAANIDLTIYEGGTFDQTFIWKTGDPAVAVDLTGYSAEFKLSLKINDDAAMIECDSQASPWVAGGVSGIYIDNPELGEFKLYLNESDVSNICLKDIVAIYDLFLYNPSGESVLKMYGNASIKAAIAR